MTMRTFAVEEIGQGDLNALDLQGDCRRHYGGVAYRIAIYDAMGMNPEAESAQALHYPSIGRLGIAWGADATWADVESLEAGIEAWLNDPEAWEAGR